MSSLDTILAEQGITLPWSDGSGDVVIGLDADGSVIQRWADGDVGNCGQNLEEFCSNGSLFSLEWVYLCVDALLRIGRSAGQR